MGHARRVAVRIGHGSASPRSVPLQQHWPVRFGVISLVSGAHGVHWIEGMNRHKFGIGDRVDFIPAFYRRAATAMEFEIVRQLPALNGEFFYRIKSSQEPHERVVGESQLRRRELKVTQSKDAALAATAPSPTIARRSGTPSRSKSKAKASE